MIQSIVVCAIGALGVAAGVWTMFGESPEAAVADEFIRQVRERTAAFRKRKQDSWNRLNVNGDGGNGC